MASKENIIPATQRKDGSWRKERRVKEGYTPQDEVPKYNAKSAAKQAGAKPAVPLKQAAPKQNESAGTKQAKPANAQKQAPSKATPKQAASKSAPKQADNKQKTTQAKPAAPKQATKPVAAANKQAKPAAPKQTKPAAPGAKFAKKTKSGGADPGVIKRRIKRVKHLIRGIRALKARKRATLKPSQVAKVQRENAVKTELKTLEAKLAKP